MTNLSEKFQFIPVIESDDYGSAGVDSDSVNMGLVHGLTLAITFGALTGNSVLKIYSGAAAGTKTTAETFYYRLGAADYGATLADTFGAPTSSAALTLTATTYDHRMLLIDVDPADFSDDKEFLTVEIDSTATAMNVACVGIAQPRYPAYIHPTTL